MAVISDDLDETIYDGNGLSLLRVEYPESVPQGNVTNVRMLLLKKKIFPTNWVCGLANGRRARVIAHVNGERVTTRDYCITTDLPTSDWNIAIDVPMPNDPGEHKVTLHFVMPDGDHQWPVQYQNMPTSSVTFDVTVSNGSDDPDDPDGDGPLSGADTSMLALLLILGAGLWARSRRGS